MLLVGPQAGQEIPDRERQHQADDRRFGRQQQAAGKHRGIAPDGGEVFKRERAVRIRQGVTDDDEQRHNNKYDHPHQIRRGGPAGSLGTQHRLTPLPAT